MPAPPPDRDAAVLGRLLIIHNTLDVMPDAEGMAWFLRGALGELPGVGEAHLQVDDRVHPAHEGYAAALAALGDLSPLGSGFPLPGFPATRVIPLRTGRGVFGCLVLTITDPPAFAPYEVFLRNTAGVIAARLESRRYAQRLEQQARELERRVLERTAELERALGELRKLWRAVEQAPVSVVITDTTGAIEYVNPAFCRVTGYSAAEALGKNPRILKSGESPPEVYRELWDTITSGREWRGTFHNLRKNREKYWEQAAILPVLDPNGQVTHYLAVKEDITERRAAELSLAQLNADLEQRVADRTAELRRAARAKDEFLATMSHELRTPLNAVLGFTEALSEGVYGEVSVPQVGALRRIDGSGRHLLSLIDDVLDVAKIEAGKTKLELEPIDVDEQCRACLAMIQSLADAKRHALFYEVRAAPALRGDRRRVQQILVNLLSNAVKFTPAGGRIGLVVEEASLGGRPAVRCTVHDSGIGIPEDQIPRLFQPFVQVEGGLTRSHNGTGLGLALVRRLAELHGGTAGVESVVGQGSRFTVVLPAEPVIAG